MALHGAGDTSHHPTERTESSFVSSHTNRKRQSCGTCLFLFVHPGVPDAVPGRGMLRLLAEGKGQGQREKMVVQEGGGERCLGQLLEPAKEVGLVRLAKYRRWSWLRAWTQHPKCGREGRE